MNTLRKIQLAATISITNSFLAMALLTPHEAFATTCPPVILCLNTTLCPRQSVVNSICTAHTPAGCTFKAGVCAYPNPNCLEAGIFCEYQ
jgi:hypothetical protein